MSATVAFHWRGLDFDTSDPQVYAPKPASLLLAEQAIERVKPGESVLDQCTGSGVVGIAVAKYVSGSQVVVSDVNEAALAAVRRNAAANGVTIEVVASDFYGAFEPAAFDVITVHPPAVPYPPERDWGLSAGMGVATNGGHDGSELVLRSIIEARSRLAPGGRLLLLLPHWSHVRRAREALAAHYTDVRELARLAVDFFPVQEGRPDEALLDHIKQLAAEGAIEMTFERAIPRSLVSVIEATGSFAS